MIKIVRGSWDVIYNIPSNYIESLKKKFTLFNDEERYEFYDLVDDDAIAIPRYGIDSIKLEDEYDENLMRFKVEVANGKNIEFIDNSTDGIHINIKMKPSYKYRDDKQLEAVNSIIDNVHGIISARTGFGKTFVAIKSITKLKKKTLVIVHKTALLDQWKQRFLDYTNLKEDDIGIIKGDKEELDKPIVIAMIQTLVSRYKREGKLYRKKIRDANFGITFFDECHITVGPGTFLLASKLVYSKRTYGLSATPYRTDSLTKIIYWTLGDIIFKYNENPISIKVLLLDMPIYISPRTQKYILWNNMFNKHRYLKYVIRHSNFLDNLKFLAKILLEDDDLNVLFLAERKDMLDSIYKYLDDPERVGLFYGGSDPKEKYKKLVLSTYQMFKDGLDVPKLNTLVFSTPMGSKVSVEQSLGRIVRQYKDKDRVYIIDIHNSKFDVLYFLLRRRMQIYSKFNSMIAKYVLQEGDHIANALQKFFRIAKN